MHACAFICINALHHTLPPLTPQQSAYCMGRFALVERVHRVFRGSFPAYSWIAEQLLLVINRKDLVPYLHRLKCKRRRKTYQNRYGDVLRGESLPARVRCWPWPSVATVHTHLVGTRSAGGLQSAGGGAHQFEQTRPVVDPAIQLLTTVAAEWAQR